jgi:hypothetical protein
LSTTDESASHCNSGNAAGDWPFKGVVTVMFRSADGQTP